MKQMQMRAGQSGFTLIELLIVVAIIGILAAIAVPAYQDYTARAQVSEGLQLASSTQTGIAAFFQQNGTFTGASSGSGGLPAAQTGKFSSLSATNGLITVTMAATGVASDIQSDTWLLSPTAASSGLAWKCKVGGGQAIDSKYLPSGCQ